MGVLHLDPFGFRVADLFVVFVGHRSGLVLYHVTEVNLVAENGFDRHIVPGRCLATQIFPPLRHVIEAPWRRDFFRVVLQGNLAEAVPLQAQIEDVPYHGSRHRIDLKNVLVRFAFPITEGRIAADILAAFERGQLHRLDLAAGVPRIEVIEHTSFGKVKRKQQKSSIHAGLRRDGSRSDSSLSDGQGAEITIA